LFLAVFWPAKVKHILGGIFVVAENKTIFTGLRSVAAEMTQATKSNMGLFSVAKYKLLKIIQDWFWQLFP
jgi:hypothetical protein